MAGYSVSTKTGWSSTGYGTVWQQEEWVKQILGFAQEQLTFFNESQLYIRYERKGPGDSIKIPYAKHLTAGGTTALTAGTPMTDTSIVIGSASISLAEYGNAVTWEGFFDRIYTDLQFKETTQRELAYDFARSMDRLIKAQHDAYGTRLIAASAGSCYVGTLTAGAGSASGVALGTYHIQRAYDWLVKKSVPKIDGYYHFVGHPQAYTGLKEAGLLTNAAQYSPGPVQESLLFKNEVGRAFGFRFFESVNASTGAGGSNATCYAFGGPSVAMGIGLPMEIRVEPDKDKDFGRNHGIAWYGVYGFTNIFPDDYGIRVMGDPDTAV